MPPADEVGVTPAAAFVAYCRRARVVDAIQVGDWLLHRGHMTRRRSCVDLALAQPWRDGADEALWVLDAPRRRLPLAAGVARPRALLALRGPADR